MPCTYEESPAEKQRYEDEQQLLAVINWLEWDVSKDALHRVKTHIQALLEEVNDASEDINLEKHTPLMCAFFHEWQKKDLDSFEAALFNGKCPKARNAADWWQEHERRDAKRAQALALMDPSKAAILKAIATLEEEEQRVNVCLGELEDSLADLRSTIATLKAQATAL